MDPRTPAAVPVAKLLHTNDSEQVPVACTKGTDMFFLPGRKPNPGESLEDTLIREVHKELSVVIQPSSVQFLAVHRGTGVHRGTAYGLAKGLELHLYWAHFLDGHCPVPSLEITEIRYVSREEAQRVLPRWRHSWFATLVPVQSRNEPEYHTRGYPYQVGYYLYGSQYLDP